jgi:dolichol-phosphate mannosyltransferase
MIIVLLPVYNEEGSIGKLLDCFIGMKDIGDFRIVAVNDGSRDRSAEIIESYIKRLPVLLINHDKNKGVTEAIRTGLKEILPSLKDDDLVLTMDSDNTHDPTVIYPVLEKFNEGYDIINTSRYCKGGKMIGVPLYRVCLSYACKFILTAVFPIKNILDYSIFYKGYRGTLIRRAFDSYGDNLFQVQGFVGVPEFLIKLSKFTPKITEIPIIVKYNNKKGASKMKLFHTVMNYIYMIYIFKRPGTKDFLNKTCNLL